jgi:tetratricopeptide (TPR) repeat protein
MRAIIALAIAMLVMQAVPASSQDRKLCANAKDHTQAIKACSEFIRANPKEAAVGHHLRGNALVTNGDLGQAIADYSKAIQLNPQYGPAYDSRAMAYTAKGDYTRAVADATKAAELPKVRRETKAKVPVKPKTKTSGWAAAKQTKNKQESPSFNPFEDRASMN